MSDLDRWLEENAEPFNDGELELINESSPLQNSEDTSLTSIGNRQQLPVIILNESQSGERFEVVYSASTTVDEKGFMDENGSSEPTPTTENAEDELIFTVFQTCDVKKCGKVLISSLMDYIQHFITNEERNYDQLRDLWHMFDREGDDVLIDLETYRLTMKEWIQQIRESSSQVVQLDSSARDGRKTTDSDVILPSPNLMHSMRSLLPKFHSSSADGIDQGGSNVCLDFGSVESVAGNQSALDCSDLLNDNNQLRYQMRTVLEQKAKSDKLVSITEEQILQVVVERDDLRKRLTGFQDLVEKNRSLLKDNEDLRDLLTHSEEELAAGKHKVVLLETEIQRLESRNEFLHDELAVASDHLEQIKTAFKESLELSSQQKAQLEQHADILMSTEAKMDNLSKENADLREWLSESRLASQVSFQSLRDEKDELERQLVSFKKTNGNSRLKTSNGERRLFLMSGNKLRSVSAPPSPNRHVDQITLATYEQQKMEEITSVKSPTAPQSIHAELKHKIFNFQSPFCEKKIPANDAQRKSNKSFTPRRQHLRKFYKLRRCVSTGRFKKDEDSHSTDDDQSESSTGVSSHLKCNRILCEQIEARLKKRCHDFRLMLVSALTVIINLRHDSDVLCRMCQLIVSLEISNVPSPLLSDVASHFDGKINENCQRTIMTDDGSLTSPQMPNRSVAKSSQEIGCDKFDVSEKFANASPEFIKECLIKEIGILKHQIARSQAILTILSNTHLNSEERNISQTAFVTKGTQTTSNTIFDNDGPSCQLTEKLRLRRRSFMAAVTSHNINTDVCSLSVGAPNLLKRKLSPLREEINENSPFSGQNFSGSFNRLIRPLRPPPPPYKDPPQLNRNTKPAGFKSLSDSDIPIKNSDFGFNFHQQDINNSPLFFQHTQLFYRDKDSRIDANIEVGATVTLKTAKGDNTGVIDKQSRRGGVGKRLPFCEFRRTGAIDEDDAFSLSQETKKATDNSVDQMASITAMPERETSETESTKGSMELESELQSGSSVTPDDRGAFPNLDALLMKLNVHRDSQNASNVEEQSESEIESKFQSLAMAIRSDKFTIGRRMDLHRRQRDLAEANVETELHFLNDGLNVARQYCSDAETISRLTDVQRRLEFLSKASERVSLRAETYGAIQQEERVVRAVEVMIMHVDNVIRQSDALRSRLDELESLLKENSVLENGSSETASKTLTSVVGGYSSVGADRRRPRRASLALIMSRSPSTASAVSSCSCPSTPCREVQSGGCNPAIIRGNSADGYLGYRRRRLSVGTVSQFTAIPQSKLSIRNVATDEEAEKRLESMRDDGMGGLACGDAMDLGREVVISGDPNVECEEIVRSDMLDSEIAMTTTAVVEKTNREYLQMAMDIRRASRIRCSFLMELKMRLRQWQSPCFDFMNQMFRLLGVLLLMFAIVIYIIPPNPYQGRSWMELFFERFEKHDGSHKI